MDVREKLAELIGRFCNGLPVNDITPPYGYENLADFLISNSVTVQEWISVKDRLPNKYRDECGNLIPFLVCEVETEYPFRALFDGKTWGVMVYSLSKSPTGCPYPNRRKENDYDR